LKTGISVAPSPFNAVKLELALILIVSCVLLFTVSSITNEYLHQLLLLGSYGAVCMLWLVIRIRYIINTHSNASIKSTTKKQNQRQPSQQNPTS
jgi:hypothetical protein